MPTLATFTNSGRAVVTRIIREHPIHLAWGAGEEAWDELEDSALPSLIERVALFNEIGRRTVSVKSFALPDTEGEIVVPTGLMPDGSVQKARYRQSSEPTPYLYFRVNYDYQDAPDATIRELGLFIDTEPNGDLPAGQMYFRPEELAKTGDLMAIQIVRPSILRSPSVQQIIEFVLPI